MNLVPKEILMSHLKRSEGAEEVSLPIDFFRDLVYQAMPRTWVGLTDEEIGMAFRAVFPVGGVVFTNGATEFAKAIEQALKDKNT
jgi:hypothetical protein